LKSEAGPEKQPNPNGSNQVTPLTPPQIPPEQYDQYDGCHQKAQRQKLQGIDPADGIFDNGEAGAPDEGDYKQGKTSFGLDGHGGAMRVQLSAVSLQQSGTSRSGREAASVISVENEPKPS
jgi:hypothetical protein